MKKKKKIVGRPALFKTVEKLQNKIKEYFLDCPDKRTYVYEGKTFNIPCPTITGLAYYLGFESRQSFYDYEEKPKFTYTIKRARLFIEKEYEMLLQGSNVTGPIFALKNFGWKDKSVIEANVSLSLSNELQKRRENVIKHRKSN